MRIGIIGATGWLGSALGQQLLTTGRATADDLVLLNRRGPLAMYHGHQVSWASDPTDLAQRSDVIVVSVRPGDWPALGLHADEKLVLSFMAGVRVQALQSCGGRVVRVMPNAAAGIGRSFSPWWAAEDVTAADRTVVAQILGAIGTADEVASEDQLDLMTALPGSGAAYPALMATAMAEFMIGRGIDEAMAWKCAEAAVCGGARLLEGRIDTARDMVAAYRDFGGTTAAGLGAAEAEGFGRAIQAALAAATDAARRMG